jgi:hypothetical protein
MSIELYDYRIYFDAGKGAAKARRVTRYMNSPPVIEGLPRINAIDYAPEAGCVRVQPYQDAWRDMSGQESKACMVWLKSIENAK